MPMKSEPMSNEEIRPLEREEVAHELFKYAHDGILIMVEGRFIDCNQTAETMFGLSREQIVGKSPTDLSPDVQPDGKSSDRKIKAIMSKVLKGTPSLTEWVFLNSDGSTVETEVSLSRVNVGEKNGILGIVRDIGKRKQNERALAAEKERLAVTLRSIGDAVISTDTEGRIVLLNTLAEKLTGWPQDDARGKRMKEIFHFIDEKTGKPQNNPVDEVLETQGKTPIKRDGILVDRHGKKRFISDSASPILDEKGNILGVVMVFRDVTQQKKLEDELVKAQKLESLGIMAGGVAHDFNNILTAIIANVSLARLNVSSEEMVNERLAEAEKALRRAKDLTQQLLTFSRGGAPQRKKTRIERLIRESSEFAIQGEDVVCKLSIAEDLWPVEVDEGQIHQVLHNVLINAVQAMPAGGLVEISASNIVLEKESGIPLPPGKYVRLDITDHGTGIPKEFLRKIFDPYFTTKEFGSGLGLASSFSIVASHDGYIAVGSELEVGTTFSIYLPVAVETEQEEEDNTGETNH